MSFSKTRGDERNIDYSWAHQGGLKLTTVRDIQAGNYCENCARDCVRWNMKYDCCRAADIAGILYSMLIPEILDREMKYETRMIL